ncbi:MAG: cohesin domain-containing protein [Anaerolineae bacterium]
MPYTRALTLLVAATLMLAIVPSLAAKSQADHMSPAQTPAPVVSVEPFLATVPIGGTTVVQVNIENPTDLIAFEIKLSFDPAVIQIDDQDSQRPGVQVGLGSLLNGREFFPGTNVVDNIAGTIDVAVTLMGATSPINPINENGELVTMTVRGEASGASPLALTEVDLIDIRLSPLPADLVDGVVVVDGNITATPSATTTPTATPSPTASPSPTATEIAATPTPSPTATSTSTATSVAASPTPTATATPSSSPTATPSTTAISDPPSATPSTTVTSTSTPVPTNTPTTTTDPAPTFTNHIQLPLIMRDYQVAITNNFTMPTRP